MKSVFVFAKYIVILGLVGAVVTLIWRHNSEQVKILIVHSYNTDLAWVNQVDDGIIRAQKRGKRFGSRTLNVRTHYMNLRNHPDCDFFENAANDVRFTIKDWTPRVVILVDDLAQGLIGFPHLKLKDGADRAAIAANINSMFGGIQCERDTMHLLGLDKPVEYRPDLVFAGVNGGVDRYGYPQATNVSGIFERKNYDALTETLRDLARGYPGTVSGIRMLNDASATGVTENNGYLARDWAEFNALPPISASRFSDWKQVVEDANRENVMLLIANYQNVLDETGKTVPAEDLIEWTEKNAKLPVLGANTRFVADGGMMTIAISGTEQGDVAMRLALALLAEDPGFVPQCPQVTPSSDPLRPKCEARQYLIGMNQALVKKRSLQLPSIYQAFSREIGTFFVSALEEVYREQGGATK